MVMLLKFGNYNKYYKYIIYSCIFNYLSYYVNSGYLSDFLSSLDIIDNKENNDLYVHPFIKDIFIYIGIIIISTILYMINKKKSSIHKKINENKIKENDYGILLIHNDMEKKINKSISFLFFIFILSYWIIIDHIVIILESLMIFDYWMFELLCISLIASKLLKINLYSHQKFGIIINSLSCLIFRIILFIILNFNNEDKDDINFYYFCIKHKWFIPIAIIIYLFFISSTSYIYTKLKFYMDLKFISLTKLLILYGSIGFVFTLIACIIETNSKCVGSERDFFCQIRVYQNETTYDSYIENIKVFFYVFSILNKKDFIIEIFLFFLGMIFYYCSLYFDMLVINYLTPMHSIFSSLIYLFVNELRELINNIFGDKIALQYHVSFLNISSYIFSLIGLMIYLEIIELNFCKLNYNLRKYINDRSAKDSNEDNNIESIISVV